MTNTRPAPPTKKRPTGKIAFIIAGAAAALLIIVIIGASAGGGSKPPTRPGEQAVYDAITAETDCASLATLFHAHSTAHDRFAATGQTDSAGVESAYMDAVYARQQQLGCL